MQDAHHIRVLLADDSPEIVSVLRALIRISSDLECVGNVSCADALPEAVKLDGPDVVLVDLTMPGRAPLEVIQEIARTHPKTRSVVFSGYDDEDTVQSALNAGASGFVSKNADIQNVMDAIREVAAGMVCVRRG